MNYYCYNCDKLVKASELQNTIELDCPTCGLMLITTQELDAAAEFLQDFLVSNGKFSIDPHKNEDMYVPLKPLNKFDIN